MKVYQLIALLQKCDRNASVMYDATAAFLNEALTVVDDMGEEYTERHFAVDDVLQGGGTIRGFVYLTEEEYTEN